MAEAGLGGTSRQAAITEQKLQVARRAATSRWMSSLTSGVKFRGDDASMFSVELDHNGFFCGMSANLCYVSSTTAYIDYYNTDAWSIKWIDEILKQLGYERDEKLLIYWSPPGMELCEGLVCIETDADIVSMIKATEEDKTLFLFLDHSGFLKAIREDHKWMATYHYQLKKKRFQ